MSSIPVSNSRQQLNKINAINRLPPEMISLVLKGVDVPSMISFANTSKRMKDLTHYAAKLRARELRDFISSLISKMNKNTNSAQITRLTAVLSSLEENPFVLNNDALWQKQEIINILERLDSSTLKHLEQNTPKDFADIFQAVNYWNLYWNLSTTPGEHSQTFQHFSKELAEAGAFDKALHVATRGIEDIQTKDSSIKTIFKAMLNAGLINEVTNKVTSFLREENLDYAWEDIFAIRIQTEQFGEACFIATQIRNNLMRSRILENLFRTWLAKAGSSAELIEHLSDVGHDEVKLDLVKILSKVLIQSERFGTAIQIANRVIENDVERSNILEEISKALRTLFDAGLISRAIRVVSTLPPGDDRDQNLIVLSEFLAQAKKLRPALLLAEKIQNEQLRSKTLKTLCKEMLVRGTPTDEIVFVAKSIPNKLIRSDVLTSICQKMLEKANSVDELDGIVSVAKSIPIKFLQLDALRNIALAVAKSGKVDQAIQIAKSIPDESVQQDVLKTILSSQAENTPVVANPRPNRVRAVLKALKFGHVNPI